MRMDGNFGGVKVENAAGEGVERDGVIIRWISLVR